MNPHGIKLLSVHDGAHHSLTLMPYNRYCVRYDVGQRTQATWPLFYFGPDATPGFVIDLALKFIPKRLALAWVTAEEPRKQTVAYGTLQLASFERLNAFWQAARDPDRALPIVEFEGELFNTPYGTYAATALTVEYIAWEGQATDFGLGATVFDLLQRLHEEGNGPEKEVDAGGHA